MEHYIYQADYLCIDCAKTIMAGLPKSDESDHYPAGPYLVSESDSPQHCGVCWLFLENPLTTAGEEYVKAYMELSPDNPITKLWAEYYDYLEV